MNRLRHMNGHRHGFTLIELCVVIVILALSASVLYPRINALGSDVNRLSHSAKQLAGVVKSARDLAIYTQKPHLMHLDSSNQTYWVTSQQTADAPAQGALNLHKTLDQGIRFGKIEITNQAPSPRNCVRLKFSPDGAMDTGVLTLVSAQQRSLCINIREQGGLKGPCEIQGVFQ